MMLRDLASDDCEEIVRKAMEMTTERRELKPHDITKKTYWVHDDAYNRMRADSASGEAPPAIVHEDEQCLTDNAHVPMTRITPVNGQQMKRLVNGPVIVYLCQRCGPKK
jgi:hypothetical protein